MKRFVLQKTVALALCIIFAATAFCGENKTLIYEVGLNDEVNSTTWQYVKKGLKEASGNDADIVILHLNTYGGAVDYADSIRTAILNYKRPVYAYIDNNAASAGALIAIACDSIYMRPGANIGAATVVEGVGGTAAPDKYQSYARSMIRSTAESHGKRMVINADGDTTYIWLRDPLVAEAMVDPRTVVPGITEDSTRVLTFTAQEALAHGFCEGICDNEHELISKHLNENNYELKQFEPTKWDSILGFLTNPAFQAILIMIMIGGIYFELQTPGVGFPSAAALVAAVLYFTPLYLTGSAADWEIVLFVVGIIALIFEIFVIPGFGVAGILGISFILLSLVLAGLNNVVFTFTEVETSDIWWGIATALMGIILSVILIIWLSHKIGSKHGFMKHTALHLEQKVSDGYVGVPLDLSSQVGKYAHTITVLRPAGKIEIDGVEYDAVSMGEFIDANEKVKVVRTENAQLYVKQDKE